MRGFSWRLVLLAMAVLLLGTGVATAETEKAKPAPNELALTTERVVVFKDGYCLVVKRGWAETNAAGEVFTENVPDAAVLGTFWAVPKEGRLLDMNAGIVTTETRTKKSGTCLQYAEILRANKGKTCTVELIDQAVLTGVIVDLLAREVEQPAPADAAAASYHGLARVPYSSSMNTALASRTMVSAAAGDLFVVRAAAGDTVLGINQIKRLTIKDMALTTERTETTTKTAKRLTFRLPEGGKRCELLMMYFTPGLRWIPTYRVDLAAEDAVKKEARVSLQAELLNEVEDLADVPVDIVVGVPNFRFKNVVSPFSLEASLRNALQQVAPQLMGQFDNQAFSNAMFSQRAGERHRGFEQGAPAVTGGDLALPAELTSGGAQDLFVYHLHKLTLPKGRRAAVPIFTATVPYRDVYTWDIRVKRKDIEAAPSGKEAVSPLTLSANEVWHQIELANATDLPWTTGAVLLMQGPQPLAQELLTYTSPGDRVRVPVTVSVDTRGNFSEKETGRQLNALTWDHISYARIEKEGTVALTNRKKAAIEVEISWSFGGCATEAAQDGNISLAPWMAGDWDDYRGSPAVNNHSTVFWRATVKPGESFSAAVKYHYFTRH
jgi:hypothetical protein